MKPTLLPDERAEFDAMLVEAIDERAEFDAMLVEAIGNDDGPKSVRDSADRLLDMIDDADRAGRGWARRIKGEFLEAGAQAQVKRWIRSRKQAEYRSRKGAAVAMSERTGVRRDGAYQVMFGDLTRSEVEQHVALLNKQLVAIGSRRSALQLFLPVLDRHPECSTVAEALAAEGSSVEDAIGRVA